MFLWLALTLTLALSVAGAQYTNKLNTIEKQLSIHNKDINLYFNYSYFRRVLTVFYFVVSFLKSVDLLL